MQVAVFEQDNSSAALGAQEALEVTMTSDASFMTMMFSNLYTNQVLASVREPICNAWDAMIDAGKTDQYLDITFDHETGDLSIRDYGKGIPKDKIAQIYGVFGGSTKRSDSKSTGGFGLGSKAPWALVESFRVTSRHKGNMSVYNMAKSTLESNGKPMIIPMVDVPCPEEESGLIVQFRVPEDKINEVAGYIRSTVLMGDIKARWNGQCMENLNLSTEPGSYVTGSDWFDNKMYQNQGESIFIRYGTVVYPILRVPGTERAISLLSDFMDILGIGRVLIQAAPDSLGLTPARESLSSSQLTENGLTTLCVDLIAKIEKEITETLPVNLAKIEEGLRTNWMGKSLEHSYRGVLAQLDPKDFLEGMQKKFYSSELGRSYHKAWTRRLRLAEHIGWKKQIKLFYPDNFTMLNKLRNYGNEGGTKAYNSDFYRNYNAEVFNTKWFIPMIKAMGRAGIDLNSTEFFDGNSWSFATYGLKAKDSWRSHYCWQEASTSPEQLMETLGFKHVVIYSGELDKNCFDANPALKSRTLHHKYCFVTKVKRQDDLTEVIAKLKLFGISVTDLRVEQEWDPKVIRAKAKKEKARLALEKARETRRKKAEERKAAGIEKPSKPRMKNALGTLRSFMNVCEVDMLKLEPEHTTDAPKFYLEPADITAKYITSMWCTEWLTEEEKDSIVVVRNGTEAKMAEKRGAVNANAYFASKLFAIVSEPGYKKYFSKLRRKSLSDQHRLNSSLFKDMDALGIKLPGLDKLTHNIHYEKVANLYNISWLKVAKLLIPEVKDEGLTKFKSLVNIHLDIPLVTKLKNVVNDRMLQGIKHYCTGLKSTFREVIQQHPERKQALKLIVVAAFNRKA